MQIDITEKIAAVVVTYNRKDLLLSCIDHLYAQTVRPLLDVIVIDNASTDGTGMALADHIALGEVIYVNTGANLGGAGGFQRGVREATERGYRYAWLMDDDCMPLPDALEELLVYADALNGDFGFLSSKVLWKDGSICAMNVQRHHLIHDVKDFASEVIPVDLASFVSLLIPTKVVQELGLPIKEFFIWTDDWEYTRRISRIHPCFLITSSVVVHESASNMGADIAKEDLDRLGRFEMLYRNDVYLYRREGFRGLVYEVARLVTHGMRVVLTAPDHKGKRLSALVRGTRSGLAFDPPIEYVEEARGE